MQSWECDRREVVVACVYPRGRVGDRYVPGEEPGLVCWREARRRATVGYMRAMLLVPPRQSFHCVQFQDVTAMRAYFPRKRDEVVRFEAELCMLENEHDESVGRMEEEEGERNSCAQCVCQ